MMLLITCGMWECVSICVLVNSTVCGHHKLSHGKITFLGCLLFVIMENFFVIVCVCIGATDPTPTNGSTVKEILTY